MKKRTLGIIVTTAYPNIMRDMFMKTIDNISHIKNRSVLLINFLDKAYTKGQVKEVKKILKSKGWKVRCTTHRTDPGMSPKLIWLRESACQLFPDAKYYLITDDDMKFGSGTLKYNIPAGQRYLECLDYIGRFENCCGVMCKGFLGGYIQQLKIKPTWHCVYSIDKGMFLRNGMPILGYHISPPETWKLYGGYAEKPSSFGWISKGYWFAKQMNVPIIHRPEKKTYKKSKRSMHSLKVVTDNVGKYLEKVYKIPFSSLDFSDYNTYMKVFGRVPKEVSRKFKKSGGDMSIFKDSRYVIDYGRLK